MNEPTDLELELLDHLFSICRLPDLTGVDLTEPFYFIGQTDQELSLVCRTQAVPSHALDQEDGWAALRINGVLDFSLIGILARISDLLARHEIGIFVVSTFQTDYILIRSEQTERAVKTLENGGYAVTRLGESDVTTPSPE